MRDTWYIDFLPMRAPIEASFEKAGGGDFVLPVASSEILGGVRPVNKTEEMIQPVGVDSEGRLWTEEGGNRQIQADWTQDDEGAVDFIKNKPSEDDAIAIALKTGLIANIPVAENGAIYVDENGAIYYL